jgi:hypothetical protein
MLEYCTYLYPSSNKKEMVAQLAYEYADAMMTARAKND